MSLCILHGVPKPLIVTIGAHDQDCGCRGVGPTGGGNPRSAGGHRFEGAGDLVGGMASDGASEWGSTEMKTSGTANPTD